MVNLVLIKIVRGGGRRTTLPASWNIFVDILRNTVQITRTDHYAHFLYSHTNITSFPENYTSARVQKRLSSFSALLLISRYRQCKAYLGAWKPYGVRDLPVGKLRKMHAGHIGKCDLNAKRRKTGIPATIREVIVRNR